MSQTELALDVIRKKFFSITLSTSGFLLVRKKILNGIIPKVTKNSSRIS